MFVMSFQDGRAQELTYREVALIMRHFPQIFHQMNDVERDNK